MKTFLLFTLLLPVLCFGRNDFPIYRQGQKVDLNNEDTLPGNVQSEFKRLELYALGGYNFNSEPITGTFKKGGSSVLYGDGSGILYRGGISYYLSSAFSLGIEYSGINFTTKQYNKLIALATPAHAFLLNFSGHILWNESSIDISVLPGYSFIKNGELYRGHYANHVNNLTGSGLCFGARIQYRRYFTRHMYGVIGTDFMYNNYKAEEWNYTYSSHTGSRYEIQKAQLNIKSFSVNLGLGYRF
jgi:hypothetical protein